MIIKGLKFWGTFTALSFLKATELLLFIEKCCILALTNVLRASQYILSILNSGNQFGNSIFNVPC
jgi:hypothetical protein